MGEPSWPQSSQVLATIQAPARSGKAGQIDPGATATRSTVAFAHLHRHPARHPAQRYPAADLQTQRLTAERTDVQRRQPDAPLHPAAPAYSAKGPGAPLNRAIRGSPRRHDHVAPTANWRAGSSCARPYRLGSKPGFEYPSPRRGRRHNKGVRRDRCAGPPVLPPPF